ncbi:DUF2735 domain-containing protein [Bradyrhizobium sp. PMVTL-01]|uniref:DUF2735 domain-containing protein n=1 Tax=unclassified Bradyrhizobium TaxID=2631580 RepID=UPI003F72BE91
MSANPDEGSAKIYQFPPGGRAALGGRRYGKIQSAAAAPKMSEAVCSESWYHEEAIRASEGSPRA